jgi:hypothetical protein
MQNYSWEEASRTSCDSHLKADSTRFEQLWMTVLNVHVHVLSKWATWWRIPVCIYMYDTCGRRQILRRILLKVVFKDLNAGSEEDHKQDSYRDRQKLDTNLCNRRLTRIIRINKTHAEKCTFTVLALGCSDIKLGWRLRKRRLWTPGTTADWWSATEGCTNISYMQIARFSRVCNRLSWRNELHTGHVTTPHWRLAIIHVCTLYICSRSVNY